MSKSDANQRSRIELTDPADVIIEKIKKAVTDAQSSVTYDPENRPGVANLIDIHGACTDKFPEEIVEECYLSAINTGEYKKIVSDVIIEQLAPIQKAYKNLMGDKAYLNKVLADGSDKANAIASVNYGKIRDIVGLNF
jgi:tryptophanyl-tRNA synthetase